MKIIDGPPIASSRSDAGSNLGANPFEEAYTLIKEHRAFNFSNERGKKEKKKEKKFLVQLLASEDNIQGSPRQGTHNSREEG